MSTTDNIPIRWKIFRIANYLLLAIVLGITAMGIFYFTDGPANTAQDTFYFILFAICSVILLTNYCSNIYLLEKYYPDGLVMQGYLVITKLVMFLTSLVITFLTLTYSFVFYDSFILTRRRDQFLDKTQLVVLFFGMILLIAYYLTWQQVALRRLIQKNHAKIVNAFLESNESKDQ
jgi:magnesium-transporting ATPase (P-type)